MSNLRHRVGGKLEAMGDKLEAVEEKSKDFIHGFVGLFGRDGRIVSKKSFASTHNNISLVYGAKCPIIIGIGTGGGGARGAMAPPTL